MILFYNKKTGKIEGTIQGRFHSLEHLKMWVGSRQENKRIVVTWKPIRFVDDKGNSIKDGDGKEIKTAVQLQKLLKFHGKEKEKVLYNAEFEPDHPQKKIMEVIDESPRELKKYKVNVKTKLLELK